MSRSSSIFEACADQRSWGDVEKDLLNKVLAHVQARSQRDSFMVSGWRFMWLCHLDLESYLLATVGCAHKYVIPHHAEGSA